MIMMVIDYYFEFHVCLFVFRICVLMFCVGLVPCVIFCLYLSVSKNLMCMRGFRKPQQCGRIRNRLEIKVQMTA